MTVPEEPVNQSCRLNTQPQEQVALKSFFCQELHPGLPFFFLFLFLLLRHARLYGNDLLSKLQGEQIDWRLDFVPTSLKLLVSTESEISSTFVPHSSSNAANLPPDLGRCNWGCTALNQSEKENDFVIISAPNIYCIYRGENHYSLGWSQHVAGVIFFFFLLDQQWLFGLKEIYRLLFCSTGSFYNNITALAWPGNLCSPGWVNGLQPYAALAFLTPHLDWGCLAAFTHVPLLRFLFPATSSLMRLPLPSPSTVTLLCLPVFFAPSVLSGWEKKNKTSEPHALKKQPDSTEHLK